MPASEIKQQADGKEAAGAAEGVMGLTVSRSFVRGSKKALVTAVVACLLIAAAIGGGAWRWARNREAAKTAAANSAAQSELQKKLAADLSRGADQSVAHDTSGLINGWQAGRFTFNDKLLAQYYMDAGAALYNLRQYEKAAASYKDALKYDSTLQQAALQGEVSAGYAAGERQKLIPLLQQLEKISGSGHPSELGATSAQYQNDIQAIEHNQKADL